MTSGSDLIAKAEIPGYGTDEVEFIEETLLACRPKFIGEWGTNLGASARIFHELCVHHEIPAVINTVDLPEELESLDRDHSGIQTGDLLEGVPVWRHRGDGVTVALEMWVRAGRPPALFFLDGDHGFENVYRELVAIATVAPRAWMLLHDTQGAPGAASLTFVGRFPGRYDRVHLQSQAGMIRMVPCL